MIVNWIHELDDADKHDLLVALLETLPESDEPDAVHAVIREPMACVEIINDQLLAVDKVRLQPA